MSAIEWTEKTWNPVVGCEIESAGCTNCYAMRMAGRIEAMQPDSHYKGTTKKVNGNTVWTGKIAAAADHIWMQPLKRKKPTTYFVNSMGDLFHPNVDDSLIDRAFAVMALSPQHTFQILTKHPERMKAWFNNEGRFDGYNHWDRMVDLGQGLARDSEGSKRGILHWTSTGHSSVPWPLPNVWLGVSVENQEQAEKRISVLLQTPASIRFISAEPLLGPIDKLLIASNESGVLGQLDWVICGGESGQGARPMHPDWARSLRDQCLAADVPFFFKQWGMNIPWRQVDAGNTFYSDIDYFRGQKNLDPKTLDGVKHHAFPKGQDT